MSGTLDYRGVNKECWTYMASHGSDSSRPLHDTQLAHAKSWLDPHDWLPWDGIRTVLCLGAGGGQQGPMFASLGCHVTVVDLCAEQLRLDREAADSLGVDIECLEGDMQDLGMLEGRRFDLVHQPISTCYVPDVHMVYRQVHGLLRPGGWYDAEHWNPVHAQLVGCGTWIDDAYVIEHPQQPGQPIPWHMTGADGETVTCWHYAHRLEDLVGGVCRAGFRIVRAAERDDRDATAPPGSSAHLSAFAPSFLRLLCRATSPDDGAEGAPPHGQA